MTYKNATEFCAAVENRLGWIPMVTDPPWKASMVEAGKVKRKIATNPGLFTLENLELAVELLAREKMSRAPVGVFAHVERALELSGPSPLRPDQVELGIWAAITHENNRGNPDGWVERFARATGVYRAEVLEEWKSSV